MHNQALHFYNKAVKLDHLNHEYWKAAARMEYRIGNNISALSAFEEASNLAPDDPEIWLQWSLIYYEQGEFSRAIELVADGLTELPEQADLYYRLAIYHLESGQVKEALNHLENALFLNFEGHSVLFEFITKPEAQKALYKIINQFKQSN